MIGRTVSNFEVLEKLGSGGMGVVYRARDTLLNRPAALKFLPPELATDPDAKARFIQEAQAASALDHPNICSIYQIGETESGELFIAMALYEGQTLKYRLKQEHFSVERAVHIATQLSLGLIRAHEAGIVHRDVKPANIMVTDRDEVKLLDFGLAKLTTGAQLTKSGSTLGTAAYMSPEQYRGEEVGTATDVWSVGVVLYEMLGGKGPFGGDYEQALMYAVLNSEPEPLIQVNPRVPAAVSDFVMACLAKDPADRPSLDDLSVLSGSGSSVTRQAVPLPAEREPSAAKTPSRIGLVAAGATLIVAVVALVIWLARPEAPVSGPPAAAGGHSSVRIAVLPFAVRGTPEIAYLGEGMVDILATKLDGAGDWRSVDPRAILGSLGAGEPSIDPVAGERVAAKLEADRFILGSIVQVGETLQLRASIYDPAAGRDPVAGGSVEGSAQDLFSLVDELAAQLLVGGDEDPGHRVTRIAAVTTESLPALKSYLEGEAHFRAGEYRSALEAFRRATELDTTFALAWYRLSVAAEWNAQGGLASMASQRALRYSSRLSKHDRDLLETTAAFRSGEALKSEQMYRTIVALYPEDVEAWFQLGEVLYHHMPVYGYSIVESREAWERVLNFESDHLQALWHLYRISAVEKNLAEMDSLIERIVSLSPGGDRLVEVLALQAGMHRDDAMKRNVIRRTANASEASVALATQFTAMYAGDPDWAARLARVMEREIHSAEHRVVGYLWEAFIEVARGRLGVADSLVAEASRLSQNDALPFEAFLDLLPFAPADRSSIDQMFTRLKTWQVRDASSRTNPQSWHTVHDGFRENLRLYLLGLLSLERDDNESAKRYARELSRLSAPQTLGSIGEDVSLSLQANIAVAEGNPQDGLRLLIRQRGAVWYNLLIASPFVSLCRDRFLKAQLLQRAGRNDEALRLFSSFEQSGLFDMIFEAPSHLRRAEIYESIGDPSTAAEHYRRFIDLWREADMELQPQVEDARERLAAIERSAAG